MNSVFVGRVDGEYESVIRACLEGAGILGRISPGCRVALKPNLTYPYYKHGVTTSPDFIRATVRVLSEHTRRIAIVETDGGYGAWSAPEAFRGHSLDRLSAELGVELVNLCDEERREIEFESRDLVHRLPLPVRLLDETDVFISMPVPKI